MGKIVHASFSAAPALQAAIDTAKIAFAPSSPYKKKSNTKKDKKFNSQRERSKLTLPNTNKQLKAEECVSI